MKRRLLIGCDRPVVLDLPRRPGVGQESAADDGGAVHFPDRGRPVGVLPYDVGMAIGVEVTRARHVMVGIPGAIDPRTGRVSLTAKSVSRTE